MRALVDVFMNLTLCERELGYWRDNDIGYFGEKASHSSTTGSLLDGLLVLQDGLTPVHLCHLANVKVGVRVRIGKSVRPGSLG